VPWCHGPRKHTLTMASSFKAAFVPWQAIPNRAALSKHTSHPIQAAPYLASFIERLTCVSQEQLDMQEADMTMYTNKLAVCT
jgi:hypothetical protein